MKKIPFFPQQNEYYCGPATLQMTLEAYGISKSQRSLAKLAQTNKKVGTSIVGMVKTLRHFNLTVHASNNRSLSDIKKALRAGEVAIICYTEPLMEWGHYAIVQNITDKRIHLVDSDARDGKTSLLLAEFKRRWHDALFTKTVRWAAFVSAPKYSQK